MDDKFFEEWGQQKEKVANIERIQKKHLKTTDKNHKEVMAAISSEKRLRYIKDGMVAGISAVVGVIVSALTFFKG